MTRPNLLLINCHDLGRFLSCYGVATVCSPNLDVLASEGVRFDRAFATAPQCSPARASLFTGQYPQQHGVLGLTHGHFGWDLYPQQKHLAQLLSEHGYRTSLVGVHHESRVRRDPEVATRLGFDHIATGGYAETVAGAAEAQLDELSRGGQPFYLQVGFYEPHRIPSARDPHGVMGFLGEHIKPDDERGITVPAYLRDDQAARVEIAELQGAIRHMDTGVGRVLEALRTRGLDDNTLVIFTTDHGLALPRAKCTLYDPGIEVALMIRAPFRDSWGGQVVDQLVSHVDVVPTVLDLLDISIPETVMGSSLTGLVEGSGRGWRRQIYAQLTYHIYYDPRRCVRNQRYKLIANFSAAPQVMDPSQSWQPRCAPQGVIQGTVPIHPPLELYDLETDPQELTNVVDDPALSQVRQELLAALDEWMRAVGDPILHSPVAEPQHQLVTAMLSHSTTAGDGHSAASMRAAG